MYLAQNLKYLREKNKERQSDIANLLSVSQRNISEYENNECEPDLEKIVTISRHYGVMIDELLLTNLQSLEPLYATNFRFLRTKHEMTQKDMANLLGLKTVSAYSKIENAKVKPNIDDLEKIADYFGVTLDQLVKQDLLEGGVEDGCSGNSAGSN